MRTFAHRLATVTDRIRRAERQCGRPPCSVKLLAVAKTKPAATVAALYRLGQRHFGESYLQEALEKQRALAHFNITWHFIGPIQSNKTRAIAAHFSWVHSVDRLKIAQRLSEQRPPGMAPLNICLQVNISGETTKSGVELEELPELVAAVRCLPRLQLRGLMAIPAPADDFASQRQPYRRLRLAAEALMDERFDTFSFGMSGDLEAAVAEGATLVRIGTALFGSRA